MENFSLSERSLQRIFKKHMGISPKKFSDITRLENSIDLIRKRNTLIRKASAYLDTLCNVVGDLKNVLFDGDEILCSGQSFPSGEGVILSYIKNDN